MKSAADPLLALTIEQHAGIAVALAEGFPRADVLAQERIDEDAYRPADVAWKKRLVEDAAGEGKLFAEYKERRAEAEDWLRRKVEPLDSDLSAWLGFLKAWASAPRPFDLLAKTGLSLGDVGRLGRAWERAFARDKKLARRTEKLAPDAQMPSKVNVEPRKLRPFPWSPGAAERPPAPTAPLGEIEDAPAATPELPPEVVVQAVTPSYLIEGSAHMGPPDAPSARRPVGAAGGNLGRPALPSYAKNVPLDSTAPVLFLRGADGLPFSPESGPSKMAIRTEEPSLPARSGETALAIDLSNIAVTPFEQPPSKGAVAEKAVTPSVEKGAAGGPEFGTVAVFELPKSLVLPFSAAEGPRAYGETVTLDPALVARAAMPFGGEGHRKAEQGRPKGEAPSEARGAAPSTPLASPPISAPERAGSPAGRPVPGPESPPRLSLLEHAALCAEIALRPATEGDVLSRAGLDAASKTALDAYFQGLRAESPLADAAWTKAYRESFSRLVVVAWKGAPGR